MTSCGLNFTDRSRTQFVHQLAQKYSVPQHILVATAGQFLAQHSRYPLQHFGLLDSISLLFRNNNIISQQSAVGRRDPQLEKDVQEWIEAVTGQKWPANTDYAEVIRDGTVLCRLMNKLQPDSIKKINTSGASFKFMENINNFQKAMVAFGCAEVDLFQTADLFEQKDIAAVTNSIFALGRQTYMKPDWPGPWLGPKPAESNVRKFDEDTLAAGKTVIGLQAGTNQHASQSGQSFGAGRKIILGK